MYLNCPNCALSMRRANTPAFAEHCPRCLGRFNRRVPLYTTERPHRHLIDRRSGGSAGTADAHAA